MLREGVRERVQRTLGACWGPLWMEVPRSPPVEVSQAAGLQMLWGPPGETRSRASPAEGCGHPSPAENVGKAEGSKEGLSPDVQRGC